MKLTKESLKQIIKEELEAVMTEDPLYGPTGKTRVLNPNDESDYEEFAKSGIRDPKAVAAKRLKDMNIAKPEGNYQWSFIVNLKSGKGNWGWQKMDNTRDAAAAPTPEEEDVRQTFDKNLAKLQRR
jgi:hypothetical protein